MPLLQILTDPKNFKFYAGGKGYVSTPDSFGQKSIPYGKDRFGGGSSKQPYIVKSIDINDSQVENTGGPDFLVRGGSLLPGKVADDVSRLTKMFLEKGTEFTVKQNLLSRLNVETQTSIPFLNQGAYTPAQTIAQAAGVATGLHLPLFLPETKYDNVIKVQREIDADQTRNRLYQLYENTIAPKFVNIENGVPGANAVDSLKKGDPILRSYPGGPGAPLGIGKTNIFFADQRTGYYNPNYKTDKSFIDSYPLYSGGTQGLNITYDPTFLGATNKSTILLSQITATGDQQSDPVRSLLPTSPGGVWNDPSQFPLNYFKKDPALFSIEQIQAATPFQDSAVVTVTDFRQTLKNDPVTGQEARKVLISSDYTAFNRNKTFKTGDAGRRDIDRTKIPTPGQTSAGTDLINLLKVGQTDPDSDLIPFYFTTLRYDNTRSTSIQFRAYLDNLNDGFTAEWSPYKFMGRGENFYNYSGFTRTVTFAFSIYAQTYSEIFRQYQRLNYLASTLTPSYTNVGVMRGNFIKVTIGDYLSQVPGIITGINMEVPNDTPWEIGRDLDGNKTGKGDRLPFMMKVSNITFIPVYDFVPEIGKPFISMGASGGGPGYSN
jgi:hypothetical protein